MYLSVYGCFKCLFKPKIIRIINTVYKWVIKRRITKKIYIQNIYVFRKKAD